MTPMAAACRCGKPLTAGRDVTAHELAEERQEEQEPQCDPHERAAKASHVRVQTSKRKEDREKERRDEAPHVYVDLFSEL